MLIQIQGLAHLYAPRTPLAHVALCGIDLEIRAGERVGIIGPTGSGKSTLVQHIAGLLTPTAGQVLLDGIPAHGRSAASRARRRQIGIAFQYPEDQIFEQTVFREVGFGPHNLGLPPDVVNAQVRLALEAVGLNPETYGRRNPLTCSGGEMRRVALASVLSMRPQVLILDEPTAGLDPRGRRDLLAHLQNLQPKTGYLAQEDRAPLAQPDASSGVTMIVVSHDLDELARLVERVVLIGDGQVVADGSVRQVLSDVELLEANQLDVPRPVALLHALQARGWQVRTDCLLPQEATVEIAAVVARSQRKRGPDATRATESSATETCR